MPQCFHSTVKELQIREKSRNQRVIRLGTAVKCYVAACVCDCRRAQLKHCLEQLKEQVPLSSESARNTTLSLLRQAQLHIKKLQEQDEHAELLKDRLRWEQRELRTRLEKLQGGSERMRNDSLGSAVSSERSDSEREDVEIDVESMVWTLESDGLGSSHAGVDHSYSTSNHTWL
ncbi:hypothetical protein cypCar_00036185 [Cyprinus carpio]|nr:hypothetical protein cypCar_00036185 [Cyprinus carpio]